MKYTRNVRGLPSDEGSGTRRCCLQQQHTVRVTLTAARGLRPYVTRLMAQYSVATCQHLLRPRRIAQMFSTSHYTTSRHFHLSI